MKSRLSHRWPAWSRTAALTLWLACAAAPAMASGCSRDIIVPVAPIGVSVVVNGSSVDGIYAEMLRSLGAKAGCNFVFSVVPRARLEVMFESGKADLLLPANRTPVRDQLGHFIPMIGHRATLITLPSERPPIRNAQELLEKHELRVAVVRGFDYGEQYQSIVRELTRQGRLFLEVDANAVARLMNVGSVDVTIMGPTILAAAIRREPRVQGLMEKLRIEPIPELPWGHSGVYYSRRSLNAEDQAVLRELLEKAARSGVVYEGFQRYHRPDVMSESVRPR
ncbi:ABC transporter substrate-binding protein [Massilia sp. YIM B04103]|uniref:substrate-binding periplasmic protein n=1 Tax=Massilia sp. YIM B04103 TaxID=2963106 RepID=UPI00210D93BA|nr:transporter substrate-binding domain-containing protein [Massilia sp. YIM B04103]